MRMMRATATKMTPRMMRATATKMTLRMRMRATATKITPRTVKLLTTTGDRMRTVMARSWPGSWWREILPELSRK